MISRLEALLVAILIGVLSAGCYSLRLAPRRPAVIEDMIVTGYCKCGECCSWHRNWLFRPVYSSGPNRGERKAVGITASGTKAKRGTIAADGARYPYGTVMYVKGYGYGKVEDRGAEIKGNHIDLYFDTHGEAEEWGVQRLKVMVWYPPGYYPPPSRATQTGAPRRQSGK
jgi:3D (Asp-Asp-Asp) domain-containing protein